MRPVSMMLKPKKSVYCDTTREDVLNLTDLIEHRIDADDFFSKNNE